MAPGRARDQNSPDRDERGESANLDKDPVERSTAREHKAACVTRLASSRGARAWVPASISQIADKSPCNVVRWRPGWNRAVAAGAGPVPGRRSGEHSECRCDPGTNPSPTLVRFAAQALKDRGSVFLAILDNSPCNVVPWRLGRDRVVSLPGRTREAASRPHTTAAACVRGAHLASALPDQAANGGLRMADRRRAAVDARHSPGLDGDEGSSRPHTTVCGW